MDDFRFAQNQPDDRWLRSRQAASGYGPAAVSSNGSHDARQPDNIFDGVPPGYRTTVSSRQSHYPAVQASNPPVPLDGSDEYPPLSGRVTRLQRRSMLQTQGNTSPPNGQHIYEQPQQFAIPTPSISAPLVSTYPDYQRETLPQSLHRSLGQQSIQPVDTETRPSFSGPSPHSRSSSITSVLSVYPQFRSHSHSVSSSASSSIGDTASSSNTSTGRRVNRLSNLDRKELCEFADKHPRMKHDNIGQIFGVERSTVSKILKNKQRWLAVNKDNSLGSPTDSSRKPLKTAKQRAGRHPELEEVLLVWGRQQTGNDHHVTDDQVREKALEVAESLHIPLSAFKASAGWFEGFKERGGFQNGKFSLTPVVANLDQDTPNHMDGPILDSDENDSTSPTWHLSETSFPPSSSGFPSPLSSWGRAPGSLSSSATSLPGLVEEESSNTSESMKSPSASGGLPSRSSLAFIPRTSSYSSELSPHLSPTSSLIGDGQPLSSVASHMTNPTQQNIYQQQAHMSQKPVGDSYPYAFSQHLPPAGLDYDLNLHSMRLDTIDARQPLDLTALTQQRDQPLESLESAAYPAGRSAAIHEGRGPAYGLRSRLNYVPLHQQSMPYSQSKTSAGRMRQSTHPQPHPMPPPQESGLAQNTNFIQGRSKVPLHRSLTDPVPFDLQHMEHAHHMQQLTEDSRLHNQNILHLDPMPIDEPVANLTNTSNHLGSVPHPHRRATVSKDQDASHLGIHTNYPFTSSSPGQYLGNYNSPPISAPLSLYSERTTFDDAFLALRKVVGFLHDRQASQPVIANSNQMAGLESLLGQFREVYSSQPPNMTPPRSS